MANTRKKRNFISFLTDHNGRITNDIKGMQEVIIHYFENIFSSDVPRNIVTVKSGIHKHLNKEAVESLKRQYTREEIERALFQIHPTKAPGLDGFHALFYQKFWNLLGLEVCNFALSVLNDGLSLKDVNHTNIVLIPKGASAHNMKDFRPISLCNVLYKIIAKVLANRLKPWLSSIISKN
ncbi:integrator complex subunit 11 [Apostasia shenzhenica]|uniref:Integrator complex subunit 11 n=1 Tax=Apostasia shenzhenica TaxID=1088818 RepID=A0A2I0A1A0_9ASPA|nr:integrator complex subunit 11 [Apostasia shenzhenica]